MKILIQQACVLDPSSALHNTVCDVLIEDGIIKKTETALTQKDAMVIDATGAYLSTGWCDLRAQFGEPGYEPKETLASGALAAASGGFTAVAITPETNPVLQSKADIEFVKAKTRDLITDVLPYGALTVNSEGLHMTEMFDMHSSGAVAFTDGNKSVMNAGVMLRSLLYVKNFNSFIAVHADETSISNKGKMNEGITSVLLGLKSIPAIAEELMIARDIELLRYTGSRIHFSHISTRGSVALIRKAKAENLPVTCDVAIANLVYDETALMDFDTNYKVNPPLRTRDDMDALFEGLNDGTIDAISSDHRPQDDEHKEVEFDIAANGMSTLQTFYPLLLKAGKQLSNEKLTEVLSRNPRKILNLPALKIAEGETANLTLFHPEKRWEYSAQTNHSLSKNSPLYNSQVQGKVMAVMNKNKIALF